MRLILLVASAVATTQASWPLTPDGWGPAKIGMSRAGVERALHARLEGEPIVDAKACVEMAPVGTDRGMRFMFMDHKLSRISIEEPSKVTTSRGIGIGASASAVHRAYGSSLKSHPNMIIRRVESKTSFFGQKRPNGASVSSSAKTGVSMRF